MLDAAQALEPAVDHDTQPGAQSLALLHAGEERVHRQDPPPRQHMGSDTHLGGRLTCERSAPLSGLS